MRGKLLWRGLLLLWWLSGATPRCEAQLALVTVSVPASVGFDVTNVSVATTGTPAPTTLSFSGLVIPVTKVLAIRVKADASTFTPPSGTGIPVSNVSWTTGGAVGGTGFNGTLDFASWASVYESNLLSLSGSVNITWTLAAPGNGIRAGNHTLTVTWKLEAITP